MIWIPACAGMTRSQVTVFKLLFRVAVFYGNDEILDYENLSAPPSFPRKWESDSFSFIVVFEFQATSKPSFPRKWESRNEKQQEFVGNDRNRTD